jgi:hypothetical protein
MVTATLERNAARREIDHRRKAFISERTVQKDERPEEL